MSRAAASSGAALWIRPLARATSGPPRSSLLIFSPSDSKTTGGPAVNTEACARHHREVGHRRDQRAVAGRCAEDGGDQRHPARAAGLGEQVGGGARVGLAVGPEAGPFEHHHQRHPVGHRDLGHPVALGVGRRADRARHHGEVLGRHHHRPAVDRARADDHGIGGSVGPPDQRPDLQEGAGSSRWSIRARASSLPASRCLRKALLPAHGARRRPALFEVVEDPLPALGAVTVTHHVMKEDRRPFGRCPA